MKRIAYLDVAKGLSMCFVLLGHIIPMNNPICRWIYSFHIPVFFIITGMVIGAKEAEDSFGETLKKKTKSLLYPYFVFSLISLVITFIVSGRKDTVIEIVNSLIGFGSNTLWFLPALFIGELLHSVFARAPKIARWIAIPVIGIGSSVALALMGNYGLSFVEKGVVVLLRGCIAFLFIELGRFVFQSFFSGSNTESINLAILSVICLLLSIVLGSYNSETDLKWGIIGNPILYFSSAMAGSGFVIFGSILIQKIKFLEFIGVNTMLVMCTQSSWHILGIAQRVTKFIRVIDFQSLAGFAITFAISLLLECAICIVIKKFLPFLSKHPLLHKKRIR